MGLSLDRKERIATKARNIHSALTVVQYLCEQRESPDAAAAAAAVAISVPSQMRLLDAVGRILAPKHDHTSSRDMKDLAYDRAVCVIVTP